MFQTLGYRLHNFKSVEQLIIISLTCVFFIVGFVFAFDKSDTIPATQEDIDELETKIAAVTEKPESLLSSDATIKIRKGLVTYTIENKECQMVAVYDENYSLISKQLNDKSTSKIVAAIISIAIAAIMSVPAYFVILILVSVGSLLYMAITKKYSKVNET